jgi:hypothetical protein
MLQTATKDSCRHSVPPDEAVVAENECVWAALISEVVPEKL